MIFDRNNEQELKSVYIHDSIIKRFTFDYDNYSLALGLQNSYLRRHFYFDFVNVLYFDTICTEPWGGGNSVQYIEKISQEELQMIWTSRIKYMSGKSEQSLNEMKNRCLRISFVVNSGNKINIIAEKMSFEDTPIEE